MNKWKIIEYNKKIEKILVTKYHATGKGLHSKLTSVESELSPELVKKIRFIATIRNKMVHEEDFQELPANFIKSNKEVIKELSQQKESIWSWIVFVLLVLALIAVIYYKYKTGSS